MKREIIKTSDGSTTIHIPEWNEQYHSIHGAIQEANHVYIQHGLNYKTTNEIAVLEIGFGTGLNSFMTFLEAQEKELLIEYIGVEAYPILQEELLKLNYVTKLDATWYLDGQVSYNFDEFSTRVTLGVDNLLDEDPPLFTDSFANDFDPSYRTWGSQFWYARVSSRF